MGYPLIDVALANGLAIMIAAYVFGDISGGVVNPAVTLGGAIAGKIGWKDAGLYMIAQVGGGIRGRLCASGGSWRIGRTSWGHYHQYQPCIGLWRFYTRGHGNIFSDYHRVVYGHERSCR